jgi:polar amino acid transport system substrate-binding protein
MRRAVIAGAVVVAIVIATACASEPTRDSASLAASRALHSIDQAPASTSTTTLPPDPRCIKSDPARSIRPTEPLPPPGAMPAGTFMRSIQRRGALVVGVDQNTYGFGYRNADGQIEGFDIDLLREVARAIFGAPKIEFRAVTSAQRIPAIQNNQVDIVASVMSIDCDRWGYIDFSTEYYEAQQKVLVRSDSPIEDVSDLRGKKVCATSSSTSLKHIRRKTSPLYGAIPDPVDLRTQCLVRLQEGLTDAIATDDTILYGFSSQDRRNVRILPDDLHEPERYGMAISKKHPEFVQFVNSVLEQIRTDGRWTRFYAQLEAQLPDLPPAVPPAPEYRS